MNFCLTRLLLQHHSRCKSDEGLLKNLWGSARLLYTNHPSGHPTESKHRIDSLSIQKYTSMYVNLYLCCDGLNTTKAGWPRLTDDPIRTPFHLGVTVKLVNRCFVKNVKYSLPSVFWCCWFGDSKGSLQKISQHQSLKFHAWATYGGPGLTWSLKWTVQLKHKLRVVVK